MTLEQTIEIPASRRIFLDLPHDLPVGRAKVEFTITPEPEPKPKAGADEKIRLTKEMIEEMLQNSPHTRALSGILSGMGDVDLDEIRTERLAKHL
ncbi:MAG: hypothetical protein FWG66_08480 [Spirochaetes bacterium]|nr:hypothetical protein [Spirochaetota bacterium]